MKYVLIVYHLNGTNERVKTSSDRDELVNYAIEKLGTKWWLIDHYKHKGN